MKKILFASTALVAFAGAAAADVELSGRAEMGVFQASGVDAQFFTDIDVTFTMSGETDGGLEFGASVDLDEGGSGSAAVANNADDGGATIFIKGDFGTVTMGDTDGAMDWALTEAGNVGNPGSIADDETSHAGYWGSYHDGVYDGQILRYDYSTGDFGIAVSVEMDDDINSGIAGNGITASDGYAIGLKYSTDLGGTTVNFGLGFQSVDVAEGAGGDADIFGISANADLAGGLSAGITYVDGDVLGGLFDNHFGLGVGYETGAISLHANYGKFSGATDVDGFGLAAAYDLGGGAVIHAGYGQGGPSGGTDFKSASLGFGFSF